MSSQTLGRPVETLLIEDNPGDARLIVEALSENKELGNLHVVRDGIAALAFLRREGKYTDAPRPDLILLDLHLPRRDGHKVLADIKADKDLKRIPVVVLTTSDAAEDISAAYDLHANCCITKPVGLDQFFTVVKSIEEFWCTIVRLPEQKNGR